MLPLVHWMGYRRGKEDLAKDLLDEKLVIGPHGIMANNNLNKR